MDRKVSRHEDKFIISIGEAEILKRRFRAILRPDANGGPDGGYFIRSLYFDDVNFAAYNEKISGVKERTKYRLRYYNFDDQGIWLEKKMKDGNLTGKDSARVSRAEAEAMQRTGDTSWAAGGPLQREFATLRRGTLRPVVIVDYDRFAFTYPVGNVRITLDMNVRTCPYETDFFNSRLLMIPVLDEGEAILEVKYDSFLPSHLALTLEGFPKQYMSVSKYVKCLGVLE